MGVNAQTSVPAFTAGQVLTAAEMTEVNTGIPVFATTVTRDAAFGGTGEKVLAEGQFAYIEATNTTQFYDGSSWLGLGGKIGQVVSADKTDVFTTTSTSYTDVTGWTATITPTASTSKVLVMYSTTTSNTANNAYVGYQILRGATVVGSGTASGSRTAANKGYYDSIDAGGTSVMGMYLDSPATTSATTYKIQVKLFDTKTLYVGATASNANGGQTYSSLTNIILMEVLA